MKYQLLTAIAIMLIASYTDIKDGKIKNWLVFSGLIIALILAYTENGVIGLKWSLLGWVTGVGPFFITFLLGYSGAGDAKFMGTLGALIGPEKIFLGLEIWAVIYLLITVVVKIYTYGYRLDKALQEEAIVLSHKLKEPKLKLRAAPILSLSVVLSLLSYN